MRPAQAIILATLPVLALTPACDPPAAEPVALRDGRCGETTVPLRAGDLEVGAARAWYEGDSVCIGMESAPGWNLTATDLSLAGRSFAREGLWAPSDVRCFELAALGVAASDPIALRLGAALVAGEDATQTAVDAWAAPTGSDDPTAGFDLGPSPCGTDSPAPCGYRTQTQSQWGALCYGGNTGCLRDQHFMSVFPEGLIVGCGVLTANLISSAAVEKALPTAGIPRALLPSEAVAYDGDGDPKVATSFFGHVVALTLNVGFDEDVPGFSQAADTRLADLVIGDPASPCTGMSVGELLTEANLALGGCAAKHTPQVLNDCAAAVNKAYADAVISGGTTCSPVFRTPDSAPQ